jgi:DNA-binding transcriptional ArsR family regulator
VFTVRSLAQAKLLSDQFRLRILREFVEEPRTTKQVADRLGENAPRLYRHVQALLDAGLLVRKGERQKRGTTERYLQAIATRFEVDHALFTAGGPVTKASNRKLVDLVRKRLAEAQHDLLEHCSDPAAEPPMVARVFVRGPRKHVERFRRKVAALLESAENATRSDTGGDDVFELTGLVALHTTRGSPPADNQTEAPSPDRPASRTLKSKQSGRL